MNYKNSHPSQVPTKNHFFFYHKKFIDKEKKVPNRKKIDVLLTCENVKKMQMKKEIQFIFDENDRRQSMLMMMREEFFFGLKKEQKGKKKSEIDSLAIV